ncbi:MAG: hypothetical protein HRT53_03485 [Colwellia sp.]|nr:hypothetical protein [Colwellia sp.]
MNDKESPFNERSKVTLPTKSQAETILDVKTLPKKDETLSPELSMLDEQWAEMAQDWQSQPFVKTDINKLLRQTKQRTLIAKLLLSLDIVATLGMLIVGLYMWINNSKDQATMIYLSGGGALSVIYVYFAVKFRVNTWRANCGSPDKAIEHAIAGCQSSLSYIKLIKLSCFVICPLSNWYLFTSSQQMSKSPMFAFIFLNVLIIALWLITQTFYRKRNKELKFLKSL